MAARLVDQMLASARTYYVEPKGTALHGKKTLDSFFIKHLPPLEAGKQTLREKPSASQPFPLPTAEDNAPRLSLLLDQLRRETQW